MNYPVLALKELEENFSKIEERIASALKRVSRAPGSVKLVAVSKNQSAAAMNLLKQYLSESGRSASYPLIFGESYLQEFKSKQTALEAPYCVHMIGPLQSNKVRDAVRLFDLIESVHSQKIALLLNKEAAQQGKRLPIFVQVNISRDSSKSGFLPQDLPAFITECLSKCAHLDFRGLMTITRHYENPEDARQDFRDLRRLRDEILQSPCAAFLSKAALELSMGMSDDFDIAVEEGATLVRVGTALFGERAVT